MENPLYPQFQYLPNISGDMWILPSFRYRLLLFRPTELDAITNEDNSLPRHHDAPGCRAQLTAPVGTHVESGSFFLRLIRARVQLISQQGEDDMAPRGAELVQRSRRG